MIIPKIAKTLSLFLKQSFKMSEEAKVSNPSQRKFKIGICQV